MSRRASATPFAKALFDVALAEGRPEAMGAELATMAGLVSGHAELQRALTHPAVPVRAKREIVDRLAADAGASTPLRRLLSMLADRDRLGLLSRLNEVYQARLLKHLGVVEAHVTTAVPLPGDRAAALADGLGQATGRTVRLTTGVDPSIMGGVVARLGSTVYDGSVARHLERIRERLVREGV
jgi:F-type H+-transporting ATPase subunit delta